MRSTSVGEQHTARLVELCSNVFGQRRLILVSNRGPVEYHIAPDGNIQARRGSGGVVTAFSAVTNSMDFTWVASAIGEGDRRAAENNQGGSMRSQLPGQRLSVRFVVTPRRVYHKYYNVFCNPLLWFLQHYMWSSPYTPNVDLTVHDAWENGYVLVNRAFADAVIQEAKDRGGSVCVMLHDYHLYLTPGFVRQALPNAVIQHFVHIPWPTPSYWQLLPSSMRKAICESLCATDVVGFQTHRDVRSFLESCEAFLPGAQVDHAASTVLYGGRTTRVKAYPLSIDVDEVQRIANSSRALEHEKQLAPVCVEKTIVRVDRAEPSKNVIRGFRAYELFLQRHPEFRGRVKFLAFLVPSKTHIRQYQRYLEEIDQVVESINASLGTAEWKPVQVFYENNYTQAIAAMRLYDILMVNPVIDGMNLVAKEGPTVNTKAGILILSDAAGAHEQLAEGAISVASADIEGTMQAIHQALTMSKEERERRAALLIDAVKREDVAHWISRQLEDLRPLMAMSPGGTGGNGSTNQ